MVTAARKRASKKWLKSDSPTAIAYRKRALDKLKMYQGKLLEQDRQAVILHYGSSCVGCGESDPLVLTIDHMDQRGHLHVDANGKKYKSASLRRWLVENNFPKGFRILCFNCNTRAYRLFQINGR